MPKPSIISSLPVETVERINARLVARGFGGYAAIAAELEAEGVCLSLRTLQRHGSDMKRRTQQRLDIMATTIAEAKAIETAAGSATAAVTATMRLIQHRLLEQHLRDDREPTIREAADSALALNRTLRAEAALRDLDERAARRAALTEVVDSQERTGGLSPEAAAAMRNAIEQNIGPEPEEGRRVASH